LPIIATKHAGIIEHIGENGIWLESDSTDEIATQIERLLGADALRRDLSKRLRKRAEECLDWDVVAESTLAVYERAIERKMKQNRNRTSQPETRVEIDDTDQCHEACACGVAD
jgi:glycosyltransferase involved in cell wall biosynthesis